VTGGAHARSTGFRLLVLGSLVLAAAAVALAIRGGAARSHPRPAVSPPPMLLHPAFSAARPLPAALALVCRHGKLWATRWSEQMTAALLQLDPATLRVVGHRKLSTAAARRRGQAAGRLRPPSAARFGNGIPVLTVRAAGSLWVAVNTQRPVSQLWQLDPRTGRVIFRTPLPAGFLPLVGAASGHTLWLATGDPRHGVIRRVDLRPA
jgi:hypothetical protein